MISFDLDLKIPLTKMWLIASTFWVTELCDKESSVTPDEENFWTYRNCEYTDVDRTKHIVVTQKF